MATLPEVIVQNAALAGAAPVAYVRERPGMSTFVIEDGVLYHTYSTYGADWTASGVCTSGSTVLPRDATRPMSGGATIVRP